MVKINIFNPSGKQVGFVSEDGVYNSYRSKRTLMYKFKHGVGLSTSIIKRFLQIGEKHNIQVRKVSILIDDFDKDNNGKNLPFFAEISLQEFLKNSVDVNYGKNKGKLNCDHQKICPLNFFQRRYIDSNQTRLI